MKSIELREVPYEFSFLTVSNTRREGDKRVYSLYRVEGYTFVTTLRKKTGNSLVYNLITSLPLSGLFNNECQRRFGECKRDLGIELNH